MDFPSGQRKARQRQGNARPPEHGLKQMGVTSPKHYFVAILSESCMMYNMAKEILLTKGKVAIVDDEDYDILNFFKWQYTEAGRNTGYARRVQATTSKYRSRQVQMHRTIMQVCALDWTQNPVDHIDHNGLNNQKSNLRLCSPGQNKSNGRSGRAFRGVYKNNWGVIYAAIKHNHKQIYLGAFKTEEEAARAYDEAALRLHGPFATINGVQNERLIEPLGLLANLTLLP